MCTLLCLWTLALGMPQALAYELPDTGQTTCYDVAGNEITCPSSGEALYGQDANYTGPQPAYRDNGDGTVTDLRTELVWQQADDGATRDWADAGVYCDNLSLGGETDWRLPEEAELVSIVDFGRSNPAIHPVFSSQSSWYWTNTEYAPNTADAWNVRFYNGSSTNYGKGGTDYVRCVRSGP
jgi:hypothetical protein